MAAIYQWFIADIVVTTTPYPIEIVEAVEFNGAEILNGYLMDVSEDRLTYGTALLSGSLVPIRIEFTQPPEELDYGTSLLSGTLTHIRIWFNQPGEELTYGTALLNGSLVSKLVTADTPDEAVDFDLIVIDGYLTSV